MENEKQINRIQEILKEFDPKLVQRILLEQLSKDGGLRPEYIIAESIVHSNKLLSNRLVKTLESSFLLNSSPDISRGETISYNVTIKCDSSITLYAKHTGKEEESDGPGGDSPTRVQAAAMRGAEVSAKRNVKWDLERQLSKVTCPSGCFVKLTKPEIEYNITEPGFITSTSSGLIWTTYEALAIAEGTMTVKCERITVI